MLHILILFFYSTDAVMKLNPEAGDILKTTSSMQEEEAGDTGDTKDWFNLNCPFQEGH